MPQLKSYLQCILATGLLMMTTFAYANEATVNNEQTPPTVTTPTAEPATEEITPVQTTPTLEQSSVQQANASVPLTETEKNAPIMTDKVNINTANAAEIQRVLLGIGTKKAEAIIQYREKNGAFTAVEQLLNVQGFGKMTLQKNRERIVL